VARRDTHPDEFTGVQYDPLPDTDTERLYLEVKQRLAQPNPHEDDYAQAVAARNDVGERLEEFLRSNIEALLAERDDEARAAAEGMVECLERLGEHAATYMGIHAWGQALAARVSGLRNKPNMVRFDLRVEQWAAVAKGAASPIDVDLPGLSEAAGWRLRHVG
jgi:hypothetical protein